MFQYIGDVALMALWLHVWVSDTPGPSFGDFAQPLRTPSTGGGHALSPPEGVSCPRLALPHVAVRSLRVWRVSPLQPVSGKLVCRGCCSWWLHGAGRGWGWAAARVTAPPRPDVQREPPAPPPVRKTAAADCSGDAGCL